MKIIAVYLLNIMLVMSASNCSPSQANSSTNLQVATFGGGCFWCIEAVFQRLDGVEKVESGYSGGFVKNPSYREVCNGTTGHAEVVQIYYDSTQISFTHLLEVFFELHDPTTLNKQGNDVGTQYRSVVFYHNKQQKIETEDYIRHLSTKYGAAKPIVTEVVPFDTFYVAEEYHQDYYDLNKSKPYCTFVITPKIEKLNSKFAPLLK